MKKKSREKGSPISYLRRVERTNERETEEAQVELDDMNEEGEIYVDGHGIFIGLNMT